MSIASLLISPLPKRFAPDFGVSDAHFLDVEEILVVSRGLLRWIFVHEQIRRLHVRGSSSSRSGPACFHVLYQRILSMIPSQKSSSSPDVFSHVFAAAMSCSVFVFRAACLSVFYVCRPPLCGWSSFLLCPDALLFCLLPCRKFFCLLLLLVFRARHFCICLSSLFHFSVFQRFL